MLVDVVVLRDHGAKLPRQQVLALKPFRADLMVYGNTASATAELRFPWVNGHGGSRPLLLDCRLRTLQGDHFLLVGREKDGVGPTAAFYPQAWWCRLPGTAQAAAAAPYPPLHLQGSAQ